MRIAIAGRPGSGKSSLFDLLVWREGVSERQRLATNEQAGLRIAHVEVPDPRLTELSHSYKPRKTTPARLEFLELEQKSGPAYPAISPERREMLAHADLILLVLDLVACEPEHWEESAGLDWRGAQDEFILLDLATVEGRLERLNKLLRIGQPAGQPQEPETLSELKSALEEGRPVRAVDLTPEAKRLIRGYSFLSSQPVLPVFHIDEAHLSHFEEGIRRIAPLIFQNPDQPWTYFCASVERQIRELPLEEQAHFLEAFGLKETALDPIIRLAYHLAGFHSFFTVGEDEVRAWTLPVAATAQEAAGAIHSDLERGFVRAEVLAYDDWKRFGSFPAARDAGQVRLEGKEYRVVDGDLINIRSGLAKGRG